MPETWHGEPITDQMVRDRLKKPVKGTALIERKEHRKDIVAAEDEQKAIARKRDQGRCRYPHCPYCARYRDLIPQAAHVFKAKGMSGDATGELSQAKLLMLLCQPIHGLQEAHRVQIEALDPERMADGPCEFYREDEPGQRYLVAREIAPFIYERD